MAKLKQKILQLDSSLFYSRKALKTSQSLASLFGISRSFNSIYVTYNLQHNKDSAFHYLQLAKLLGDSLSNVEKDKTSQYQNLNLNEQIRLGETEKERIKFENRVRTYSLMAAIAVFMLIALLFYRSNRHRKKANDLLQIQKEEIQQQKKHVEETLTELKTTQSQLIQSEKMASLGELTAGIAHEIQNPLNFVNNFSDVNKELLLELKEEALKVNMAEVQSIADDVISNEEKINHHGKRADAIVKGMLQHSRKSEGKKESTDINGLADEYLRLSYHGLRAMDNSFYATIKTDFDPGLAKINIIPHDIGRVLLNLYNNAFYAVGEREKLQPENYEPTVSVSTKRMDHGVEIKVRDNGLGIPQKVLGKIFQPFFTTKPTGQGTGLGLSLSYDIIKAHGGEIKVNTQAGESTSFDIILPDKD